MKGSGNYADLRVMGRHYQWYSYRRRFWEHCLGSSELV